VRHLELSVRDWLLPIEDTEEEDDLVDDELLEPPLRPRIKASIGDELMIERDRRMRKLPNSLVSDGN
jgi:hypothetical protein